MRLELFDFIDDTIDLLEKNNDKLEEILEILERIQILIAKKLY